MALSALGMAGLVACSGDGEPAATSSTLPPRVTAMWAEDSTWVAVAPPKNTYVPGPDTPSSVHIEALMHRGKPQPDAEIQAVPEPQNAAQTLYADPTVAEPWADRAVMVGRVASSDIDGMFAPSEGTTAATIQETEGRVGHYGDLWFAAWPIPTPTCDVCAQEAFVIGPGLSKERVLAIAETVRQKPAPHADPTTLPEGLRSMGSAPGAQGSMSVGVWPQELVMRSGDASATFQVWSGDPRLYAHLAFWSQDGKPIETWRRGWTDVVQQGKVIVDIASTYDSPAPSATDKDALRRAAAALVRGDADAVDAALDDAIENLGPLPSDRNLCEGQRSADGVWTTLSGVEGHLRWGLTMEVANGSVNYCDDLWFATSGGGPTGSGAGPLGPIPSDGIRFTVVGSTGGLDESTVHMVAGDVPDSAVRVVATMGEQSKPAELADLGPEAGRRWFATAFLSDSTTSSVDVVAYDAAGDAVATGSQE